MPAAPELDWRPVLMFALGGLLFAGTVVKSLLRRLDVPALVGYLILGIAFGACDRHLLHLPVAAHEALGLLADLGIVCLLFHVGLDSDLRVLLRELPLAAFALTTSMAASFACGYLGARLLGFAPASALFVGTALSATSIAIAVYVWEGEGLLRTATGALVLDIAELDDLATVLLMVVLFAALPALSGDGSVGALLAPAVLAVVAKILLFGAVCWLFARFGERRLMASFKRLRHAPDPMIAVVGIAIVVAALAAWLGFSLAVGALFAGLVFSGDPRAVRLEASFQPVHDLLAPFFFLAIGAHLDLAVLGESLVVGAGLLLAAVAGKFGGTMLGLWRRLDPRTSLIVAVSMVPRAEIALFVVDQGRRRVPELVPATLQGAMTVVVAATCLGTPPLLRRLLARGRQRVAAAAVRRGSGPSSRSSSPSASSAP